MAAPQRLTPFTPVRLAWAAAGAGCLAAFVAASQAQPLAALLALGAGAASGWVALHEGRRAAQTIASGDRRTFALGDLGPLLEALPEPALLLDQDGRIAGANPAAQRKFAGAAPGRRLSSILRQPDVLDAAHAAAHDGGARTVAYETSGQVDEQVRCYVAPVHWGAANAALLVFHDETSRLSAERMRSDFLANASHELRTPLAALMLLIETLSGPAQDNPEDRARFLAMMQVQGERMRRLIDDLLSLSRIELDEHVPPSDRADLAEVARETADSLSAVAAERRVRLEVVAPPGAPVLGHRFQLGQVVQNLVDNAIKYSPEGGVVEIEVGLVDGREDVVERAGRRWPEAARIALLTPTAAAARGYAYVRVSDSGPGVPRRFLPKLGARFFRVEREMGNEKGGTGLGLAIVKHIVNRHRGGVLVESEPGRGSAFAAYVERAP